jgi:hypothetical protein
MGSNLSEVFPNFKYHIQFEGFDGNFDSDSDEEIFPHFNENNGNVLLQKIDTTPVPEVPREVQDTDHGPFIMCGKLTCANGKKIMELVKDPESGYQRHPQFGEFILVPNQISNVISSDQRQYYRKIEGTYWVSTQVHYLNHLSLEQYIEKYCELKQIGDLLIPVYKS